MTGKKDNLVNGVYENLSANLRFLRLANHLSQERVSQFIHTSRKHYSECERGIAVPSLITVCILADIYKIQLDTLIASKIAEKAVGKMK